MKIKLIMSLLLLSLPAMTGFALCVSAWGWRKFRKRVRRYGLNPNFHIDRQPETTNEADDWEKISNSMRQLGWFMAVAAFMTATLIIFWLWFIFFY